MAEERPFYEELLDYAVYAPAGLVLRVVEDLPQLVDKGRKQLASQVGLANMLGKMAVGVLRNRVERVVGQQRSVAVKPTTPTASRPSNTRPRPTRVADSAIGAGELAVPGYDSLAASQVVARLSGLSAEELQLVRRYEQANRARRTILLRIAQLAQDGNN